MQIATQFPTPLAHVIASIESSCNPFATRFEPGYYNMYKPGASQHYASMWDVSEPTAHVLRSMSFGLYQIMGGTVLQFYAGTPLEYCADVQAQHAAFSKFVSSYMGLGSVPDLQELLADPARLAEFAVRYNGPGGRVTYADAIRAHAKQLGYAQ